MAAIPATTMEAMGVGQVLLSTYFSEARNRIAVLESFLGGGETVFAGRHCFLWRIVMGISGCESQGVQQVC